MAILKNVAACISRALTPGRTVQPFKDTCFSLATRRTVGKTALLVALLFAVLALSLLGVATPVVQAASAGPLAPVADDANVLNLLQWVVSDASLVHYTAVDEAADCSDATDSRYVYSVVNGTRDTYYVDISSIPNGSTITRVDITVCYRRNAASDLGNGGTFYTFYRTGGTNTDSGMNLTADGTRRTATQQISANFTKTSQTTLEIGVRKTNNILGVRVYSIAANVQYDPPATLTVYKVMDGGSSLAGEWQLHVTQGGADVTDANGLVSPQSGSDTGTEYALVPGTYVVSETDGPTGFVASFSGDCDSSGSVTLASGDVKSCTITNVATGTLTVYKVVDGAANAGDWSLHVKQNDADVTDVNGTASPQAGSGTGTTYTLPYGSYVVSEDGGPQYYDAAFFGDCDTDGNVALGAGDNLNCTITNTYNPPKGTLTVYKLVSYGTGQPSDWNVHVKQSGTDVTDLNGTTSPQAGSDSGTAYTLIAGDYKVTESGGPGGYTAAYDGDCDANGNVTIGDGDDKVCKIINVHDAVVPSDSPYIDWNRWRGIFDGGASGGTYRVSRQGGDPYDSATLKFTGTGISWYYMASPQMGKAEVWIDGVKKDTVCTYAASKTFGLSKTYNGLADADHTFQLRVLGQGCNANGKDVNVALDKLVVNGTTYEGDSREIKWNQWRGKNEVLAEGGNLRVNSSSGAIAMLRFMGREIDVFMMQGDGFGQVQIRLDGVLVDTVDLNAPTLTPLTKTYTGLEPEVYHSIEVKAWGGPAGSTITLDGFDGPITPIEAKLKGN